jgi:plastocyanin
LKITKPGARAYRVLADRGANSAETLTFLALFAAPMSRQFRTRVKSKSSNINDMKTKKLLTVAAVSAGLAFGVTAQAKEEKHEEQSINSSEVPAAVQQAAKAEAKGGTIVRWEKEGANFEAVIEKNGKQIGVEMDANGKVLSKHNEAKEHRGEGSKY